MINLTLAALTHIRKFLKERSQSIGIRVGIKTTGCSGLSYILEWVDLAQPDDTVYLIHDIPFFIKTQDQIYLQELTIDYVVGKFGGGFEFTNPLEKDRCGCGMSFKI